MMWKEEKETKEVFFSGGINKSKELPFIILCIEEYKGMAGKEVIDLFNKYSVCEYIQAFYEVLHTTGRKYIINDIDLYIKSHQAVKN